MKISKIITDKYKLLIPPTVYYDLLADVVEAEEEQEPCEDCDYSEIMDWEQDAKTGKAKPIYWCERHKEPCDDAISRQAVLDLIVANHTELNGLNVVMYSPYYKDIKQLPSVQPIKSKGEWERVTDKTGHLVWECKCGWQERLSTNFCPNCGTDMRGEE